MEKEIHGKRLRRDSVEVFESDDVRELRGVLQAISSFLRDIMEPVNELLNILINVLDGEKLGREVSAFYNVLLKNGVPEELAKKMTMEFFRQKLEATPSIDRILASLTSIVEKPKVKEFFKKEEESEEKKDIK